MLIKLIINHYDVVEIAFEWVDDFEVLIMIIMSSIGIFSLPQSLSSMFDVDLLNRFDSLAQLKNLIGYLSFFCTWQSIEIAMEFLTRCLEKVK